MPGEASMNGAHYLRRPQLGLIFLAFFAVTLPLSVMVVSPGVEPLVKRWVMTWYLFLLGSTHFVITWALYLNSANLRHFRSSFGAKIVYFVAPVAIMSAFFAMGVLEWPAEGTLVGTVFF